MAKADNVEKVKEISGRFNESSSALLTEYRGLTVSEIAEVRNALRGAGTEYKVLKNTLTRLAVREVGLEELADMLEGPTAIAFIHGDAVEAAKALDEASKKYPVLVIKGGVLDGKILDAEQANALAKLQPREVQLATIVMMVNTPLQQTANVLTALLRDFGSMLTQVLAQKEEEAPAPEPAAEAAAPEPEAEAPAEEAPAAEAEEQVAAAPEAEEVAQPEATAEEVSEKPEESEGSEESKEE